MQIKDLKQDKHNYRTHNERNLNLIKKSVSEVGLGRSVVIDNENEIVCGNGLVSTLDKNTPIKVIETDGTELVVVKRTDLNTNDEKRKQLAIMDNSTSDSSEFDLESLQADFDVEQLQDWGLDVEFESLEEKEIIEDEVPEEVETRTKLGDIWQLGNNRLMCGDSTLITDVEKLMGGAKADMVFTDPPYGMGLNTDYSSLNWGDRKGKKYEQGKVDDFNPEMIDLIFSLNIKEVFLWGADYYSEYLKNKNGGSWIVWDKTLESNGDAGSNSEFELCWSKQKHKREVIHFNWFRYFGLSKQDIKSRVHPTQKPLQVITPFLEKYSKEEHIIIDLFGGSGSTLIACEQLDRKCYMMELDPKYCDVILQRWENLTGKKAELLNG